MSFTQGQAPPMVEPAPTLPTTTETDTQSW